MGAEKTTTGQTTSSNQQQTQQATATPEERELNRLRLEQTKAFDPIQRALQAEGGQRVLDIFRGNQLPGNLGQLGGITEEQTAEMAQKAIGDIRPGFQQGGLLDSGVAASVSARTAGDIRRNVAESNINTMFNLLNLAVGGQAQIQAPALSTAGQLGQSLSGLRSISSTGSRFGNAGQVVSAPNPFISSFQRSFGSGLGGKIF